VFLNFYMREHLAPFTEYLEADFGMLTLLSVFGLIEAPQKEDLKCQRLSDSRAIFSDLWAFLIACCDI